MYNVSALQSLLAQQEQPANQLLEQAIYDQGQPPPPSKEGFWNKMFKERKKESELLAKAYEEWVKTDEEFNSATRDQSQKKKQIEEMTGNKQTFIDSYVDLRSSIQNILSSITDAKMAGMVEYEQLGEDIEDSRNQNENIGKELEMIKLTYTQGCLLYTSPSPRDS